jgi:catechol 2,3-dioxygenase-like lactoylglutathione lyase family enzyme
MIRGGLVTLFVEDVSAAVRFYIETLGMKLVEENRGASAVIDAGDGFRIALRGGRSVEAGRAGSAVGLIPKVPLREAIAIFENRGVTFEVSEEDGRTLARFHDPDGNPFYLFQDR